jgi:membrane protease YdiL (CAAX protease family)
MRSYGTDTKGIVAFLVIAFGLTWAVWAVAWLAGVFDTSATGQVVVALGAFGPAIASIVVRRWVTREGFADAGLRLSLRGKWPYYLFAWLIPLPVVGVIYLLASTLGVEPVNGDLPLSLVLAAVVGSLVASPIFWGEEFGWRGYLQLRLFRSSPVLAAVATGLVWGVFHYPVILVGYEGYENLYLGLLVFPVFTILLSIVFGWLRQRTGSVWSTCLAHSAANGMGGGLTAHLYVGGGSFVLASYAGVLGLVPLGLLAAWLVLTGRLVAADAPSAGPRLAPR